jgi:hypothetical protein
VLIAKLVPAALIALLVLGFAANETLNVKDPNADRVAATCEMENITEVQVHECRIRSAMQAPNSQRLSELHMYR